MSTSTTSTIIAPRPRRGERDFIGYAGAPPDPRWPGGARVAVSMVVNFEEGAEFVVSEGDDRNEAIYEVDQRVAGPDPCIESHFEYATRAGWWRIMDLLDAFGIKVTVSACGRAVERSPALAADAVRRGHEVAAHGWRWESHAGMDEATERESIARTVRAIAFATGQRPLGWHTRSASSPNTRRLLIEEGGFLYDSDAYNDDLPYFVSVSGRRHLVIPYAFDTNDMHFQNTQRFRGADFADYVTGAFDWLLREGERAPKMMSIGLHPRMIGRPGRMGALECILRHITTSGVAFIAPRVAIARHWLTTFPETKPPL
jgi:allantoinase